MHVCSNSILHAREHCVQRSFVDSWAVFQLMSKHFKQLCAQCSGAYLLSALILVITVNVICVPFYVCVVTLTRACVSPQQPVPHTRSSYMIWQHIVKFLSSITRLCLHHLQSSEHFQTGHAAPTHPLPRGLSILEEAVWAVFSPEWAQPSSAQQGPLQSGFSALSGQIQCGWRVNIWIWTPTGPQQHVGFPLQFSQINHICVLSTEVIKTVATVMVLSNWFSK